MARPALQPSRARPAAETIRDVRNTPPRPIARAPASIRAAPVPVASPQPVAPREGEPTRASEEPTAEPPLADGAPMAVPASLTVQPRRRRGDIEAATPLQSIIGRSRDAKPDTARAPVGKIATPSPQEGAPPEGNAQAAIRGTSAARRVTIGQPSELTETTMATDGHVLQERDVATPRGSPAAVRASGLVRIRRGALVAPRRKGASPDRVRETGAVSRIKLSPGHCP